MSDDSDLDPTDDLRTLQLSQREVELLLKYGYPFPDVEAQLRNSQPTRGHHRIQIDSYWISLMIGDLIYSAKKIRSSRLLEELDELCSVLEAAEVDEPRIRGI